MKEITEFGSHKVEIWRRPYQRSLNLRLRPDGSLRVTCSRSVSRRAIFQFIHESASFIDGERQRLEEWRRQNPIKQFLDGEAWLWMGEAKTLRIRSLGQGRPKAFLREDEIIIEGPELEHSFQVRQDAIFKFFRTSGRRYFAERLTHLSQITGLTPSKMSIRGQTTRWGSCSFHHEISLNWKLMAAPAMVIDYVIIHELCHIRFPNHSKAFWSLVAHFYPEYKLAQRWLREHGPRIGHQFQKNFKA